MMANEIIIKNKHRARFRRLTRRIVARDGSSLGFKTCPKNQKSKYPKKRYNDDVSVIPALRKLKQKDCSGLKPG